ncbi:LysR family transcriptional regulator [Acidiferrimicrobium sp. IK]|uniref:LysR family transcriptional regulator n=1 Tax=Acidiferrimicrobium sp. IK TaxID=2871700 RepID=UPI0021CAF91A|nr:LysR family transcriptional regulator [Acidiferrimicrobium sp. IK]MCU4185379.1 LysR family transcriptional regulator [Acidiferrimicrobium sp. IK]
MDERQLEILRELGEQGSVQAVADALAITPSAVSQQLKLLQREASVPLTRRVGRVLRLTQEGERLAEAAVDVQAAMSRAREIARGLAAFPSGTVSVCAFNSAALALFAPLASRFPADGVRVTLSDEDVAQGDFPPLTSRYDIVIAHRLQHTPAWPDRVAVEPLLREQLDVALPVGHPLTNRGTLRAKDVARQAWITTHREFPIGATLDTIAAASGRPIEIRHRVNEFTIVAELVRAGQGLAFLPRWTQPRPEGVVLRPLADLSVSRDVDALIRPENATRPAVSLVVAELRAIAAALINGPRERPLGGSAP